MDQGPVVTRPAAGVPELRRVLVDLLWVIGLGVVGLILSELLMDGTEGILGGVLAWMGWVVGFALAGLRAEPGCVGRRVFKLWASVALALLAVGCIWFLWLAWSIPRPFSECWQDALAYIVVPLAIAVYAAAPALAGWALAAVIRRFRPLPCDS